MTTHQWRYLWSVLCLIGAIAIAVIVFYANRYDVPVVDVRYEIQTVGRSDEEWDALVRVEVKDYSNVPKWVEIGSEHSDALIIGGIFLFITAFVIFEKRSKT